MAVFRRGSAPRIVAGSDCRIALIGGEAVGERFIWWNFVAGTQARIDEARRDWAQSAELRFQNTVFALPHGENAFIPPPQK